MVDIENADIFELKLPGGKPEALPIQDTNHASFLFALKVANSLSKKNNGQPVTVYRNGCWLIDISAVQ